MKDLVPSSLRRDRIERLLSELSYEIQRGVLEREIEPDMHFTQLMPLAGHKSGCDLAALEVHLYPTKNGSGSSQRMLPKLRVVE